jgi:hypothetical protein
VNGSHIKYIKDLGRPLGSTIAIDNNIVRFAYDLNNVIPIKSWRAVKIGSGTDSGELLKCLDIVDAFYTSRFVSVRDYLRQIFGLTERVFPLLSAIPSSLTNYDFNAAIVTKLLNLKPFVLPTTRKLLNGSSIYPKNLTLIVDMDETLLHCIASNKSHATGIVSGRSCLFRPHWKEFLVRASKDYELVLWSYGKSKVSNLQALMNMLNIWLNII